MGLLQQIKHDLRAGLARMRFGTARAANRVLEETELLKLRLEVRKLDRRLKDLCRDIGERAVELHERGESSVQILSDREIVSTAEQVTMLKAERARIMAEMDDMASET
ncbi:MAG: hypothetical protein ACREJU_07220 [Nitrospiraceae bacterium]